MDKAKVSVLITFYNSEKYVDKAMESVLSQVADFSIRIIVGDDGSSDRTCQIINEWIKKYPDLIELHVMERGEGPYISGFRSSQNRLNLLKYVDTDYFIFLDGDDYYEYDNKLRKQVGILDDPSNSDCIACGHNAYILYSDGKKTTTIPENVTECKFDPKTYWAKYYCHTDSLLFRSSVIKSIDFDLMANDFNDNLITFCAIQSGKIYYIPQCWVTYLQTGEGVWTSKKEQINWIRNAILIDLCNKINPSLKRQTNLRMSYSWKRLYQLRKTFKSEELTLLEEDVLNHDLKDSYKWIHYNELGPFAKLTLLIKVIYIGISKKIFKLFNKVS